MFSVTNRWFTLAVIAVVWVFVWAGLRPAVTGAYCHKVAVAAALEVGATKFDKDRYDGYYDICKNKWGL